MLSISIHEHNSESHRLPDFLVFQMNCPDSSQRNKAKNALSLAEDDFSRLGRGKNTKNLDYPSNLE